MSPKNSKYICVKNNFTRFVSLANKIERHKATLSLKYKGSSIYFHTVTEPLLYLNHLLIFWRKKSKLYSSDMNPLTVI